MEWTTTEGDAMIPSDERLAVVVLISGRGSNLQAILEAAQGDFPARVRAVISNRAGAEGLERARRFGIPTHVLDHRRFASREDFEAKLAERIDAHGAELVALAGFMRILTATFVSHYAGRLMNIHPSLLPKFPGLDTHQRAIDAGEKEHGASVHFVMPELDCGPIITQARVPILDGDDAESLAERVLRSEHLIYPQAIKWYAERRLRIDGQRVLLDGHPALEH